MHRTCLLGASLTTGNMGVSALAASLVGLIQEARPDADISLFVGSKDSKPQTLDLSGTKESLKVINYRLSPRAVHSEHLFWLAFLALLYKIAPSKSMKASVVKGNDRLKTLLSMDFIGDIRGGDSFSDIYGLKRFMFGCLPDIIILLLGKDLYLLPQTYGPYRSPLAKKVARFIIARSRSVLSRDREGLDVLRDILGPTAGERQVSLCPDVAFTLRSIRPEHMVITPPIVGGPKVPLIGLNVNGLLYNGGYTRNNMFGLKFDYRTFVHTLVSRLLDTTEAHILLVPHTFAPEGHVESDNAASADVLRVVSEHSKGRVHLVEAQYDQFRIKGIIGLCDFFVGSRMHACIAALSQGIPTVGVAYSRKFGGVFDTIDMDSTVLDATKLDMQSVLSQIADIFEKRDEIGKTLIHRVQKAQDDLGVVFRSALNLGAVKDERP